jgi:hypothetical protein
MQDDNARDRISRNEFENVINDQIIKAKSDFTKIEDYTPSLEVTSIVKFMYKIGDIVKTPEGKKKITDVRFNLSAEIYKNNPSLDFLSHKNNVKKNDLGDNYKIQRSIDVYYKFETKDNSNLFYTEAQLIRYYETGDKPIHTKKFIDEMNKVSVKKRSFFKRLFHIK